MVKVEILVGMVLFISVIIAFEMHDRLSQSIPEPTIKECLQRTYSHKAMSQTFEVCIKSDTSFIYKATSPVDSSFYSEPLKEMQNQLLRNL